jgi:dihydrofolate reductase
LRRIRYAVAASLDGYIAGPDGEYDWIIMDPEIDFEAIFRQYDTLLMGRRTYDGMPKGGDDQGMRTLVFSRTLRQQDHPGVTIVSDGVEETLHDLRAQPGKDIWLFGGGELFRSLLEIGQVDGVEVAVIPVLVGGGIPLLPSPAARTSLSLTGHRVYGSGIVLLEYAVKPQSGRKRTRTRRARTAGP